MATWRCACGERTTNPREIRDRENYGSERFISSDVAVFCSTCGKRYEEVKSN